MDCFPFIYILNIIFVILYVLFFSVLFLPAMEGIIVIALFILIIFSGYSVFVELLSVKEPLNLSILNFDEAGPIIRALFSNFTVIILLGLVILSIFSVTNGGSPTKLIIFSLALIGIISIKFGGTISTIPYWLVLGIPILIDLIAFTLAVIAICNASMVSMKGGHISILGSLINIQSPLYLFKIFAMINILLFIAFLIWFFLLKSLNNDNKTITNLIQSSTLAILPFLYGTSAYLLYISQEMYTSPLPGPCVSFTSSST